MDLTPEIKFARASGSTIAYMAYGDGEVTICAVPPMAQNVEMAWESPRIRDMFERFASFSRQVAFDKRGTGMSDRGLDIPSLDERVDELRAVMDAENVDHAWIHGLSEGGPMAIMFAATYPERVDGLILEGTGARLWLDDSPDRPSEDERAARRQAFIDVWGTTESMTLSIFAPSLLDDPEFTSWWPRYERNAASRDALDTLFDLMGEMDARDVLPLLQCPVLLLHRRHDRTVPLALAEEAYALLLDAGVDVTLEIVDGSDHYTFAGDVEANVDAVERFVTGTVSERPVSRSANVEVRTLGSFGVVVDGTLVPTNEWGSKRARTLLQRLSAARGWPVTRDELIELLWPDDDSERLGARLSVQLSAVRRVLGGGVVADRSTVRLDTSMIALDLHEWFEVEDPATIVAQYTGPFIPDATYDDWAAPTRLEIHRRLERAVRDLTGDQAADSQLVAHGLTELLVLDPFDLPSHRALVRTLDRAEQGSAARSAFSAYEAAATELGVMTETFDTVTR